MAETKLRQIPSITSILIFVLAISAVASPVTRGGDKSERKAEMRSVLERSDALFAKGKFAKALSVLEKADRKYPGNAEILWRLASYMINEGDAEKNRDEKKQENYYNRSVKYAEGAVRANASSSNAHAYLAAAYGSYAMFAGGKEKVKLANLIRDELDIALKLDSKNQVAHTIYGTWHREVADVSWIERKLANIFLGSLPEGSIEQSIRHLNAAIRVAPNILRHRYELGRTYITSDQEELARKSFKAALRCPNSLKVDDRRRKKMKEWLAEYGS